MAIFGKLVIWKIGFWHGSLLDPTRLSGDPTKADLREVARNPPELPRETTGKAENPFYTCPIKLKEGQAGRGTASPMSLLSPERQPSAVSALPKSPRGLDSVTWVHPKSLTANHIALSATSSSLRPKSRITSVAL